MLERTKYGIEYISKPQEERSRGLVGIIIVVVVLVAIISLIWTLIARWTSKTDEELVRLVEKNGGDQRSSVAVVKETPPPKVEIIKIEKSEPVSSFSKRPQVLKNLLMRLEEAEKRGEVELAVTTIESIRALPGSPAADIDDSLARRLGSLNVKRLFIAKNAQWVKRVEVRRGDFASRIAAENGSTLASMARLNGGNVDTLKIGAKVYVMDHPRFNLVIHHRTRTADLQLNGKFFKRYDLVRSESAKAGAYEIPIPVRPFWNTIGVEFAINDRTELEILMPKGASVLVSDL